MGDASEAKPSKNAKKEDAEEGETENKASNWGDNVVGANALTNRRLLRCLSISDTQQVLVYGDTHRLLVADCATGELIASEQPHSSRVTALGFNREKKIIVTAGGNDKKLVVWDLTSMKIVSQTVTDKKVVALAVDNAGEHVLFAEKSGEVFSKPLAALDTPAKHLLGHISSLTAMVLSEDGSRVLTGDRDEKIRISHYPCTFDMLAVCLAHTELIACVETYGDRILSAGADAMICLWRLEDATLLDSLALSESAAPDKPIPEPSAREREAWDFKAAGTAQATATLSGRFRGKNEAAPVSCMALHRASGLVAVAVEKSAEVQVLQITPDDKLKSVGTISLEGNCPLGLEFLSAPVDGKPVLLLAAPFQEDSLLALSLEVSADGALSYTTLSLGGDAPAVGAIRAIAECAKQDLLANPPGEHRSAETAATHADGEGAAEEDASAQNQQQQYVQKRRRHTEPGWKDLHGKNK